MTSRQSESPILLAVQRDIASMKTRGAGEIAKQAALALADSARSHTGKDVQRFRGDLLEAARMLAAARPTAVSLRNGLNFVLDPVLQATTVAEAQKAAIRRANEFANRVTEAKAAIAKAGARLIRRGDTVLTHCHSTAALGAIIEAHRQGKAPKVFATETRPFRQGLITSRALREAGVDVTLVVDSAMLHVLETQGVKRVVIGADTIDAEGGLYNKIGTRLLALAASSLKVPVHVCAETYKFSPYALEGESVPIEEREATEVVAPSELPGVKILNPVFDRTAPRYITNFVTEEGPIEPKQARGLIKRTFGGTKRWI